MKLDLDPQSLRTLAAIADSGTFARAAAAMGRTPPAIGLQMRRLENQLGVALFAKQGRRMVFTRAGQELLEHARLIIRLNDKAVGALTPTTLKGEVRLGTVQDFADTLLEKILVQFTALHPAVRLHVHVGRSQELANSIAQEKLDLALAAGGLSGSVKSLGYEPMMWIAARDYTLAPDIPVPLVLFDAPCPFRDHALSALVESSREWNVCYTSPSLSGIRAAVAAGLGVTVRTQQMLGPDLVDARQKLSLPKLPKIPFALYQRDGIASPAIATMAQAIKDELSNLES